MSEPRTEQRKAFEQWYATNAFNYERNPIGSRECGLQWAAWKAAQEINRPIADDEIRDLWITNVDFDPEPCDWVDVRLFVRAVNDACSESPVGTEALNDYRARHKLPPVPMRNRG